MYKRQGDEIVGDCRPSQDEDKFSPLLFVKTINGDPLEIALKRRPFERLTPISVSYTHLDVYKRQG